MIDMPEPVRATIAAVRARTTYDGPWQIVTTVDGEPLAHSHACPSLTVAVEQAYGMASYADAAMRFLVVRPDTSDVYASFRGQGADVLR